MTAYIKVDGSWKEVSPQAKINGEWKKLDFGYVKVLGTWKEFYSSFKDIFVAANTNNLAGITTDGITWTQATLPTSMQWEGIAYGNNTFIAVGYNNGQIAGISTDKAVTWTATTLPSANLYSRGIARNNENFVVIDRFTPAIAISTNGITWTQGTLSQDSNWETIIYGGDKFIAAANAQIGSYSTNGTSWISLTFSPPNLGKRYLAYGNNIFVFVGQSSSAAGSSTDGITWTARTMPASRTWIQVIYGNNTFVSVANNSAAAATSTDGITWTARTLPSSQLWQSVTYGNGIFIAVSSSTAAATSTDGITWTARTAPQSFRRIEAGINAAL